MFVRPTFTCSFVSLYFPVLLGACSGQYKELAVCFVPCARSKRFHSREGEETEAEAQAEGEQLVLPLFLHLSRNPHKHLQ